MMFKWLKRYYYVATVPPGKGALDIFLLSGKRMTRKDAIAKATEVMTEWPTLFFVFGCRGGCHSLMKNSVNLDELERAVAAEEEGMRVAEAIGTLSNDTKKMSN